MSAGSAQSLENRRNDAQPTKKPKVVSSRPSSSFSSFVIPEVVPEPVTNSSIHFNGVLSSEWERHDTSISYAQILVEKQLRDGGSTVASRLLVDVPKKLNNHGCLEEPKKLANMLEDRLEVLLRPDDNNNSGDLNELLARIGYKSNPSLWYSTRGNMRKNLISYKKRTFLDSFVKYMTCKEFPPTMMFKLDLSFLPDEFFGCDEKVARTLRDKLGIELPSHHQSHLTILGHGGKGNMRRTMEFQKEKTPIAQFQFGGPQYLTAFFMKVLLPGALRECGAAIPGQESISDMELTDIFREYIRLGYLLTIEDKLQGPHTDYSHSSIQTMVKKFSAKKKGDALMAWNWDMPQNPNGMRLAVWGTEYPQSSCEVLYQVPMNVNVYGKEILLWRGDLIHGGSLSDPEGKLGALRQHGFLPLHELHAGMAAFSEFSFLGNTSRTGDRYDILLKGLDGKAFE